MSFPAGALKLVEVVKQSKVVELAESFSIENHPREADVFIGYSTTQGQVSPIDREEGTHFFQVFLFTSRVSGRGYINGDICLSVCVSVCEHSHC